MRLRKENFEVHGTDRAQFVPGRSWAAWSRALGLLLPPLDVADIACGEGYLSVETAQWAQTRRRHRSLDRRAEAREGTRRPPRRQEHHVEARRHGEGAARRRVRRCRAAIAGAASCGEPGARVSPRPRACSGREAVCSCSICASTIKNGFAIASAIAGWASPTTELEQFLTRRRPRRRARPRGIPAAGRSVHGVDCQRRESRERRPS